MPRAVRSLPLCLRSCWLPANLPANEDDPVRRYLAMDVIIPYVIWITILAFLMDAALRLLQRKAFPWFASVRAE